MRRRALLGMVGAAGLAGCTSTKSPGATGSPAATPSSGYAKPTSTGPPVTVATGLNVPWGIAFLPGGDALVTERETGRVLRIPAGGGQPGEVRRIADVATDDSAEGGLLGVAVASTYATDGLVYVYYTSKSDNRIARFTAATGVQPILTGLRRGTIHNGGRIAFGPDGKLYAGVGETGDRGLAQDRTVPNGKILRINPDGSIPADNPFPGSPVWSLGHRNVQGLAWDAAGRLWSSEFGQDTWDEINLIQPGRNYGWPVVEGVGDTQGGRYTNPLVTWRTSDASPSGAAIVGDTMYVGALRGEALLRVTLDGTRATAGTPLFKGAYGRIRAVQAAPDGRLWIGTSNRDGRGTVQPGDDRILAITV